MQLAKEGSCTPLDISRIGPDTPRPTGAVCGMGSMRTKPATTLMLSEWLGTSMEEFAGRFLTSIVGEPVVDQTGLSGRYDFKLEFERTLPPGMMLNGVARPDLAMPAETPVGPGYLSGAGATTRIEAGQNKDVRRCARHRPRGAAERELVLGRDEVRR